MTTTTTTTHDPATSAGPGAGRFEAPADPRPRPYRRKVRLPWVLFGVLLVVGSGLTFAVWADSADDHTPVLVLARDVEAGQTIEADDLTTVGVGSRAAVNVLGADRFDDVVGRPALVRLGAGTLVSDDILGGGALVDAGRALVAVSLPAETVPAHELRAGDAVMAVETPGIDGASGDSTPLPRVWAARVFSVASVDGVDGTALAVITLDVDPFSAAQIAAAAAAERVRLVAVPSVDGIPRDLLLGTALGTALDGADLGAPLAGATGPDDPATPPAGDR